jgi:hypothetical protein
MAFLISGAVPAVAARAVYKSTLTAGQVVATPPVVSAARATFKIKTAGGANGNWGFIWANLTSEAIAGHIHCGAAGTNGPVGVTVFSGTQATKASITGSFSAPDAGNGCGWTTFADIEAAMAAGTAYIVLKTVNYPEGELRGQLALG